jgi:hypothetical protein
VIAHVRGREKGEGADGVVDTELDCVIMEAGVVAAVAKVQVLGYAEAEVGCLADIDTYSVKG